MPHALVVGGAGYIGAVATDLLLESGWDVTVADNLSTGHPQSLPATATFIEVDIRDRLKIKEALQQVQPDVVLHFAAKAYVGDSFPQSPEYFDVNVGGTTALLAAMHETGVKRIVFSSSCTVYGEPDLVPMDETAVVKPAVSPYGQTKQMCETAMRWQGETVGLSSYLLRYFNAAGAWKHLGEDHQPETHLIPIVIDAALGRRGRLKVFGSDYPTPDGTCIRDYVHVRDLASAHLAACEKLLAGADGHQEVVNLGTGIGSSIFDVIKAVEEISGESIPYDLLPRRPGDPPELVASNGKARSHLGWEPKHSSLRDVVESAWEWRKNHPDGYPK